MLMTSVILALGVASSVLCQQEGPKVSGVLEYYFRALQNGGHLRTDQRAEWLNIKVQLRPELRLVGGTVKIGNRARILDESYLEWGQGHTLWRMGRFRSAFGHSDWSARYYDGFVRLPIMRTAPLAGYSRIFLLTRLDAGLDLRTSTSNAEYSIGCIDASTSSYQIMPQTIDHVVARIQTDWNSLLIGVNALAGLRSPAGQHTRLFLLDGIWSVPQWQMIAEIMTGEALGGRASGYHLDIFWHPVQTPRTTFHVRTEWLKLDSMPTEASLHTAGIKHFLTPNLVLSVGYSWGNESPITRGNRGWYAQLLTLIYF
ncbi:MAG: hypothetical protein HPY54_05730 [Chthonomonadetes bacterium]|nr:hypothetical protein [Chthonomonadetes bacterium]